MASKYFVLKGVMLAGLISCHLFAYSQVILVLQPDSVLGKDAILHGLPSLANTNWANEPQFCAAAWTFISSPGVVRAIVDFDLSVIPPNATVLSATLSLYAWDMFNSTGFGQHSGLSGSNECWIERIINPWSESTVTWSNQPSTTAINRVLLPASTTANQDYPNINVTALVQDMINNSSTSHGFMLKLDDENYYRRMNFCTSDHPMASKRPKLEIVYDTIPATGPCPTYSYHTLHICSRDSAYLQNAYQKAQGVYLDTFINTMNHDSIRVTALYVMQPVITLASQQICDGDSLFVGGGWQKYQGFYTDSYISQYGCDSIVHTQLKVVMLNTSIQMNGNTLTSNQTGATYQWIDCGTGFTPISGAVNQSYTPIKNGNYAVIITKDGCSATSPCVMVNSIKVSEVGKSADFKILPNPARGLVTLLFDQVYPSVYITVTTLNGQEVEYLQVSGMPGAEMDLSGFARGTYLVTVSTPEGKSTLPLLLE